MSLEADVIRRYRTRGGASVLIERFPGRWRRYTWHCLGCYNPPQPRRRLRRSAARRRGWRHAMRCEVGGE